MSRDLLQRIRSLRSLERGIQPDDAWVTKTREILCMQVRNSLSPNSVGARKEILQTLRALLPEKMLGVVRGPAIAALSIFAVVLGGSVASVSAAENSLPGDFLYSLKLATEQARLALTSAKEDKLKLKVEFTTRRGEELKKVATTDGPSKPVRVEQATEILKRDLNTLKQQLEEVKSESGAEPKTVVEAAKLVDQKSNALVQVLQETKSSLSNATQEKVTEAQAAAVDAGAKAIQVLVENSETEEVIPKNEVVQAIQDHRKTVEGVTGPAAFTTTSASFITATGTSTAALQVVVEQIKTATQQAFALKKISDQASSTTAVGIDPTATSTPAVPVPSSSSTSSSSPLSGSAQTSTTPEKAAP